MSLDVRSTPSLTARPLGAIAVSLATVLALTALLGVAFLPHEFSTRRARRKASIQRLHTLGDDHRVLLLTRTQEGGPTSRLARQIVLHDPATGRQQQVLVPSSLEPLVSAVSKDARRLFLCTSDRRLLALDLSLPEPQPIPLGRFDLGHNLSLCASADGETLVASSTSGLVCWSVSRQRIRWSRPDLNVDCFGVAPSAPVLIAQSHGQLVEIDLSTGDTQRLLSVCDYPSNALVVSPDGQRIARLDSCGRLTMIDWASGTLAWPLAGEPRLASPAGGALAISPDSRFLVTASNKDFRNLVVWSMHEGTKLLEFPAHTSVVVGTEFDQSGRWYSWCVDGVIRTWESFDNDFLPADRGPAPALLDLPVASAAAGRTCSTSRRRLRNCTSAGTVRASSEGYGR